MKPPRSDRPARACRSRRPFRAELVCALLALLAQIVVPHLHRWHVATHRTPIARDAGRVQLPASTTELAGDSLATAHAESTCPICQALAASHDFLAAGGQHAAPVSSTFVALALVGARSTPPPAGEHAPRGPPRTA